jgi:Protein of unknown function (DUF1592)/Protein of unknown function (DUF1588)/Protein of unknown function (DUF1587)/Protein of unknown function (DUF1585)/Protein of unknown function (DUF1595)/Planctomycete cytochrome C
VNPRHLRSGLLALATLLGSSGASLADEPRPPKAQAIGSSSTLFEKEVVPFLAKNCFACHGGGKNKGDLALDTYREVKELLKDREVWENVAEMVRTGEMPPKAKDVARLDPAEAERAMKAVDEILEAFDCSGARDYGRVTIRRLNRTEYNNTIRDLVGVDFKPAADFPNDDVGYGFDNIGDVLSTSPMLLEKYLSAAEMILEKAIVIADVPKPKVERLGSPRARFGDGGQRRGGGNFLFGRGSVSGQIYLDEGDYTIRAEVYGLQLGDEPVRAAIRLSGDILQEFEVKATEKEPMTIEAKARIKAGSRTIGVSFLNPYTEPLKPGDPPRKADPGPPRNGGEPPPFDPGTYRRLLVVRNIALDGPHNPPPPQLPDFHKRIFAHKPDLAPREAAREIVARFADRAFRRPSRPEEVEKLLKLYDKAEVEGDRFEDRVRLALQGVLVWPDFLFRVELDPPNLPPGTSYPIGEYELASRLSYFLWSSMPDAELFDLAGKGQLRANLEAQVLRMLADPKSVAFVQNFSGQWLTTRKLAYVAPDPKEFPGFDEELRSAMARETELFFEAILRENRSILDLLDADFSYVNERLAKHYGIDGVTGPEFRRVKLPGNRGGVLTQASVLTLTSNPTRTSPVKRGKWVLDQILGTPPPPPPPDVPALEDSKQTTGTLRQQMEQHRANATCASCHQRMDPIGFAFENYDAVGAWRDKDGGDAVDASGVLPGGRSFKGPSELKSILRGKKDQFNRCLVEKVLTYAIGRGLEYYDRCAVDEILDALRKDDRFATLIVGVAESGPFLMRTTREDER